MSSRKEEERNEKIIRGLMKLPPNRRCINCNGLELSIVNNRQQEIKAPSKSWRMLNKPINSISVYKDWLYSAISCVDGSRIKDWRIQSMGGQVCIVASEKRSNVVAMSIVEDFIYLNNSCSTSNLEIWLRGTGHKVGRLSAGSKITSMLTANDMILCGTESGLIKVDSVAEEVKRQKSTSDMVFLYGGVGPLHSDVSIAGVAKAFGVSLDLNEEFEECLRDLYGEKCTADCNEMAQLPQGITELVQHEKLPVPLIKCENVMILSATNVEELEQQWDSLIDLRCSNLVTPTKSFVSKHLTTSLSDLEVAQPLSKLCIEFPDIHIGCYRKFRSGPITVILEGKDEEMVEAAMEAVSRTLSS